MKTIIVIPTYNEKDNIGKLSEAIKALNLDVDILFVDDNSPDGTGDIAEKLASQHSFIKVIHRDKKEGWERHMYVASNGRYLQDTT